MEYGSDLAGCLRKHLQHVVQRDLVEWETGQWQVEVVHEDRTATLRRLGSTHATGQCRVLLRDCRVLRPEGCMLEIQREQKEMPLLHCAEECNLDCRGRVRVNGQPVAGRLRQEGVHYLLPIGLSQPVPANMQVRTLTLTATGMDQGWGNTGDSGLLVCLVRPSEPAEPLAGVVYNRNRSAQQEHQVETALESAVAPSAGDRLEVLLRCPNYPGWSAFCRNVTLSAECSLETVRELPWNLSEDWEKQQEPAFFRLWAALGDDDFLQLDMSHLSLAGQQKQHVWKPLAESAAAAPEQTRPRLVQRLAALRTGDLGAKVLQQSRKLLQKLDEGTSVMGAPATEAERRARYAELAVLVHQTFDHIEACKDQDALEAVLQQYADCVDDCIYRWEREICNMHDLVTGETCGDDALDAEDAVLRVLFRKRRQMAEGLLHQIKGATETADMHFESHFFASVHFGLSEQISARRDPHRLTYLALDSRVRPEELQRRLFQGYTPSGIRAALREEVFESQQKGAQALREKLLDWLRAQVPCGFRPSDPGSKRQEGWLFNYCHDDSFRITDEALNYMLCCMHILSAHPLIMHAAGYASAPPARPAPPAPPAPAAPAAPAA